jgi:phosphate transport system substrate-binding protein
MKKLIGMVLVLVVAAMGLAGCGKSSDGKVTSQGISVVSREEGSGTRGAFIELFGIEQKDASGKKVDHTMDTAEVTNSTAVMMTTIAGNEGAIGYISLGSLNDSVKGLKIDGAQPTAANIENGTYKVVRPFNIVLPGKVSDAAQDFINFIMSDQGQKIVEDNGYIAVGDKAAFTSTNASGKIVVAGSSSVTPVMEKLQEAYVAINTNAQIEIQQSDSTTGITSVADGVCDIGMASRDLKQEEIAKGLTPKVIAKDGIVVIVNNNNTVEGLTSDQVKSIFTGEVTSWADVR